MSRRGAGGQGFTLIELLVVVAVIALLIGVLLPTLGRARQAATDAGCLSNLRQIGVGAYTYSVDHEGRIHGLSWTLDNHTQLDDVPAPASDLEAAVLQTIKLIRDFSNNDAFEVPLTGFFPYVRYGHLPLTPYFDDLLTPHPAFVCPADTPLETARRDPNGGFDPVAAGIHPAGNTDDTAESLRLRFAYSSSYYFPIAVVDTNQSFQIRTSKRSIHRSRWRQDRQFVNRTLRPISRAADALPLENPRLAIVASPGQKIMKFHETSYHRDRTSGRYYFLPGVMQPVLLFDGSARAVTPEDMNPGWEPERPASYDRNTINVMRNDRDPSDSNRYPGYCKWTRGGLRGIDLGGSEVETAPRIY
ncbi:MAG: type II secretion system protein [Planctomycetota bacterium]